MATVRANSYIIGEEDFAWSGLVDGEKYEVVRVEGSYIYVMVGSQVRPFHYQFFGYPTERSFNTIFQMFGEK